MSDVILKVENISKQYRLGLVGTGTLTHDLNRWWYRIRGKEDPYLTVGTTNDRSKSTSEQYVWALRDINFEVKRGEVLGIIGKNGAGKSTLLKILAKVTGPTTGEVKYNGRIASLLEVGTGFHPELTGKENIFLNGAILGMTKPEIESKLDEIIEFSGCQMYIDTPVKRYSSGMRVRLAFAVAAHLEPDILIVDEVLAVGDAEFQKKAIGKMQDISMEEGRTVLFVSHNMAAVKSLCTRAIVIENGKVVYEGDQDSAVNFYLTNSLTILEKDLNIRNDRSGSGEISFKKIQFFNRKNKPISNVISGQFLGIRIDLDLKDEITENIIFGFSFYDSKEGLKTMMVSDEMGLDMNTLIKREYIEIVFEELNLRGGKYYLHLIISKFDTNRSNHIDNIRRACEVNVLAGDIYKTGKLNREYSSCIIPCKII